MASLGAGIFNGVPAIEQLQPAELVQAAAIADYDNVILATSSQGLATMSLYLQVDGELNTVLDFPDPPFGCGSSFGKCSTSNIFMLPFVDFGTPVVGSPFVQLTLAGAQNFGTATSSIQLQPLSPDPNAVGIGATFSGLVTLNLPLNSGIATHVLLEMAARAGVGNLSADHTPAFFYGGATADFFNTAKFVGIDFFDVNGNNINDETSYSFSDGLQVPTGIPVTTTPEPGSMALMATGLAAAAGWRRRRRRDVSLM
jgi:hypothetical protein